MMTDIKARFMYNEKGEKTGALLKPREKDTKCLKKK
jgi:hypothetical protein